MTPEVNAAVWALRPDDVAVSIVARDEEGVTCRRRMSASFAREHAHGRNGLEVELLDCDLPKTNLDQFL